MWARTARKRIAVVRSAAPMEAKTSKFVIVAGFYRAPWRSLLRGWLRVGIKQDLGLGLLSSVRCRLEPMKKVAKTIKKIT